MTLLVLALALLPLLSHSSVQYVYLSINYPMWGKVNGTPALIKSGFYPVNTLIQLPPVNYTYINSTYRLMLVPNATFVVLKGNTTIYVSLTPQYLVQVQTEYPLNVSVNNSTMIINGSFWANASSTVSVPPQVYMISQGERAVLANPATFTVNGTIRYEAEWVKEFYVEVRTRYNVTAFVNGTLTVLQSGWYPQGTRIVSSPFVYLNPFTRLAFYPVLNVTVDSPIVYSPNVTLQFFVQLSKNVTVPAIINGNHGYLSSGWYNSGTQVLILVGLAPVSRGVSFFLTNASPASFTVGSYTYVTVNGYYEYYLNLSYPVNGTVNGVPAVVTSGWYRSGTVITLNSSVITYQNGTGLIVRPNASIILMDSPVTVSVEVTPIYLVTVNSPYPLKAFVDGSRVYLKTGWYPANTTIVIPPQHYYVNSTFRVGLANPVTINVTSPRSYSAVWVPQVFVQFDSPYPVNATAGNFTYTGFGFWANEGEKVVVQPYYYFSDDVRVAYEPTSFVVEPGMGPIRLEGVKQYLVVINGERSWMNAGSQLSLYTPLPFYEQGFWYGTVNVTNGQVISVNSPLVESLAVSVNLESLVTGWTFIIALLASAAAMLKYRRRRIQ